MQGLHPWPACRKKQAAVTTGGAQQPAFPARMALTAYTCSPRGPALLSPSLVMLVEASKLGLSTGRPGPHDFAVRTRAVRPHDKNHAAADTPTASRAPRS